MDSEEIQKKLSRTNTEPGNDVIIVYGVWGVSNVMGPVTSSRPEQSRIIRIVQSRVVWLGLEAHHHQLIYSSGFH